MKKWLILLLCLIAVFASISCAGNAAGQEIEPTFCRNVTYGTDPQQVMDLILPIPEDANGGVILFIHGGGWVSGDKNQAEEHIKKYQQSGYITATMNYRFLSDDVSMADLMDDITAALLFIRAQAEAHGMTAAKAMLVGWSAGGQMAELYAYTKNDASPIPVECAFAYSGVADMNALSAVAQAYNIAGIPMQEILSHAVGASLDDMTADQIEEMLLAISPIRYADTAVPTVICHGVVDDLVPYGTAETLKDRLDAAEVPNTLIPFPRSGHELQSDREQLQESLDQLAWYAAKYLK